MDTLYRYLNVSCSLSKMLVMTAIVLAAGLLTGHGVWWSLGYAVASLLLMQIAYVAVVAAMIFRERERRD